MTAIKSFTKAVNVVREGASLEHSPGLTPAGLAGWLVAHTLGYRDLDAALAREGSSTAALLRKFGLDG